jgi:hypothetical protein
MPVCRERDPAWLEVAPGQLAACHLHDPAVCPPPVRGAIAIADGAPAAPAPPESP